MHCLLLNHLLLVLLALTWSISLQAWAAAPQLQKIIRVPIPPNKCHPGMPSRDHRVFQVHQRLRQHIRTQNLARRIWAHHQLQRGAGVQHLPETESVRMAEPMAERRYSRSLLPLYPRWRISHVHGQTDTWNSSPDWPPQKRLHWHEVFSRANLNACAESVLPFNVLVIAIHRRDHCLDTHGMRLTERRFSVRRILAFRWCQYLIGVTWRVHQVFVASTNCTKVSAPSDCVVWTNCWVLWYGFTVVFCAMFVPWLCFWLHVLFLLGRVAECSSDCWKTANVCQGS